MLLVELFFNHGADPNIVNKHGNTALHFSNHEEITALLIQKGADINAANHFNQTPLQTAFKRRQWLKAKKLIDIGAEMPDSNANTGETAVHFAMNSGCDKLNPLVHRLLREKLPFPIAEFN